MITFDRETHTYELDGRRLPSVTQIISALNPEIYAGVPEQIMQKKADYGQRVHEWVETYVMTGRKKRQSETMKLTTDQVKKIVDKERLIIHSVEQIVYTEHYAGTYDMYGTWRGVPTLIDIKTTAELHEDLLSAQLGFYKYAATVPIEKTACLWLPKAGVAQLIEIEPISRDAVDWMVYRYESEHNPE